MDLVDFAGAPHWRGSTPPPTRVALHLQRSGKIGGRDTVANALLNVDAPAPNLHLLAPNHQSLEHGPFLRLAPWPCPPVPVLSPAILCARMNSGASALSMAIGCMLANVKTVVRAARAVVGRSDMASTAYGGMRMQKNERMRLCLCACAHSVYIFEVFYASYQVIR